MMSPQWSDRVTLACAYGHGSHSRIVLSKRRWILSQYARSRSSYETMPGKTTLSCILRSQWTETGVSDSVAEARCLHPNQEVVWGNYLGLHFSWGITIYRLIYFTTRLVPLHYLYPDPHLSLGYSGSNCRFRNTATLSNSWHIKSNTQWSSLRRSHHRSQGSIQFINLVINNWTPKIFGVAKRGLRVLRATIQS